MSRIYPSSIRISHDERSVNGRISLNRSKSISNRALIIRSLCTEHFQIHHLSDSDDTQILDALLSDDKVDVYDAHHAGTTYRFLCSVLSQKEGTQELTGSSRMKERPIGALVDALRSMGADISYLENDGYPPLKIGNPPEAWKSEVTLPASISSQYISSLMMIAPSLPAGLKITLEGDLVSKPYLEMTANIMRYFGALVTWQGSTIVIAPGSYQAKDFTVESDWSAASYYYSLLSMCDSGELFLEGLYQNSVQGDSAVAQMALSFGIETSYEENGIRISKSSDAKSFFEYDFIEQPDLAQTFFVMSAGLGINGLYSGLKTLRIKETDRISAMKAELGKYQSFLSQVPERFAQKSGVEYYMQEGKAIVNPEARIQTYRDHRMAMAFAPLAMKFPIVIDDPGVVSKSYPNYWNDLKSIGFKIEEEI